MSASTRRRKLPATTLLYALGLSQEDILDYFYAKIVFKRHKDGSWHTPVEPGWMRNAKVNADWKNGKTGEVIAEAGSKITVRLLQQMAGRPASRTSPWRKRNCSAANNALDMVNPETGEIYVEAGDELTAANIATLIEAGDNEITTINVDGITIGSYVRNTLAVDKNHSASRR